MINVFFKQLSQSFFEDGPTAIQLIHSCDSFLSKFPLFFNRTTADMSLDSSLSSDVSN